MSQITEITTATFAEEVLSSDRPVLVDFWAPWCGPCRAMAPVLEEIAAERPDLKIVKVNTDEQPQLGAQFGVMGLPTLVILRDGQQVAPPITQAAPKRPLLASIDTALGW